MTKVYDVWHVDGRTDTNALVHARNKKHAKQIMMRWMGEGRVQDVCSPQSGLEYELFTAKQLDKVSKSKVSTVWIYDQGT